MTKAEYDKFFDAKLTDMFSIEPEMISDQYGIYSTGIFKYSGIHIIINRENGLLHLSASAKFPLGYKQLKEIRYNFLPNDLRIAQIFPPREEFVNLHENCWHLWEM